MVLCWCWTPKTATANELNKLEMNRSFSDKASDIILNARIISNQKSSRRNDINAKYVILILTSCVSGPISLMQPMTPVIHSQHLMGLAGPGEDHSFLAGLLLKYFTSKYGKGTCTTFGTPSKCFPNISVHNII
ncbi:unnamed protein product [Arctia plantaginis]|uniref:Uncharacterized protein n=1 Tax=Arctia plantaginis TaxID=874455 RepID=A0A8S0ZSB6_ARCPL|nr:unnamed protein product [Arctia plantaginis]